tara:strand:+ start:2065 stop:2487 length:423 start_codon:yes stop_codon:yes gene_type:complete
MNSESTNKHKYFSFFGDTNGKGVCSYNDYLRSKAERRKVKDPRLWSEIFPITEIQKIVEDNNFQLVGTCFDGTIHANWDDKMLALCIDITEKNPEGMLIECEDVIDSLSCMKRGEPAISFTHDAQERVYQHDKFISYRNG